MLDRFYPIVPGSGWLARIAPLGVKTVQLRIKDRTREDVRLEIAGGLQIARRHGIQLIVNDYWTEALDAGADFVHLGQEDLRDADLAAIRRGGLRLGVSTHDEKELETALAAAADYVALGPIFETKFKAMAWAPQGLDRLREWKRRIGDRPLVAIGGLTPERGLAALAAGADSLAVITDFMAADDPERRIRQWVDVVADYQ